MFDKIHQKYCQNIIYQNIIERIMHIPFSIIVYSFIIAEFVCDKLNIDSEVFETGIYKK